MARPAGESDFGVLRLDIAVIGNSAKKGDVPTTFNVINNSPGLKGFWKLHASADDPALTGDPDFIANLEPSPDHGHAISLDIARDGRVTVTNGCIGFSRTYNIQ
ncbi:MAG TPA: hypothetical protein VG821_00765 [Rhizomicrobium sp.]|nr:hypothetical protein [Rhizomicrobium sp.]